MEKAVRLFLMICLAAMALSSALLLFNTARYLELEAYEPRVIDRYGVIEKSPPVERAATSSHATTTLKRSSGSASPF